MFLAAASVVVVVDVAHRSNWMGWGWLVVKGQFGCGLGCTAT